MKRDQIKINYRLEKEGAVAIVFSSTIIEEFLRIVLATLGINWPLVGTINVILCGGAIIVFLVQSDRKRCSHNLLMAILLLFALVGIWLVSVLFVNNDLLAFNKQFFSFIPLAILFYFCGNIRIDLNKFIEYLKPIILIAVVYGYLTIKFDDMSVVYLNLAYNIIPWIMIANSIYYKSNNKLWFILMIILIGMIIISGARMPLLCLLLYFFFVFLWKKSIKIKTVLGIFCVIIFAGLFLLFVGAKESRSILMLIQGGFFKSNERIIIYRFLINQILNNPFRFRGFYADRFLIGKSFVETRNLGFYLSQEAKYTVYAHDFFLEVMVDLGICGGLLVILLLGVKLIVAMRKLRITEERVKQYYGFMMISIGFFPLLVSSSFLVNLNFWMMLGWLNSFVFWDCNNEN